MNEMPPNPLTQRYMSVKELVIHLLEENKYLRDTNSKIHDDLGKLADIGQALINTSKGTAVTSKLFEDSINDKKDEIESLKKTNQEVIESLKGQNQEISAEVIRLKLDLAAAKFELTAKNSEIVGHLSVLKSYKSRNKLLVLLCIFIVMAFVCLDLYIAVKVLSIKIN